MVYYIARPGPVIRVARSLLFFIIPFRILVSSNSYSRLLKRLALSRLVKPPLAGAPLGSVGSVRSGSSTVPILP